MSNNDDFANAFENALNTADTQVRGQYATEISGLTGLSDADLKAITPRGKDSPEFQALVQAVQEASARNESNAALVGRIQALGAVAVSIAQKVPSLAALL